ncbi:hypothetical protein P5673_024784 [Acropora cervicornis]|uniref:Uncharacterized protein n=1 Tax=Acropora cervicornis TaxID=6130 RepID=A0AAD9UXX4_ACRCE|nr:hypothetical protein P5673_024784 [Acropora cervicornis]
MCSVSSRGLTNTEIILHVATLSKVTVWNIEDRSNPKEKHIAALIGILLFFHNLQTSISFFVCTQARNYLISTKETTFIC